MVPDPVRPDPRESPAFSLGDWAAQALRDDPSLPLAAVPSLTFHPPGPEGRSPLPAGAPTGVAPPAFSPSTQYVAWRHPPCHLAYGLPRSHEERCVRSPSGESVDPLRGEPKSGWARRDMWMRLATPGGALSRTEYGVLAGD